jgi:hypothetical protein
MGPLGWLVESGDGRRDVVAPWLADYGLVEGPEPGYRARTFANARDSDGTLSFGSEDSPGAVATSRACRQLGRPVLHVEKGVTRPANVESLPIGRGRVILASSDGFSAGATLARGSSGRRAELLQLLGDLQ